MMAGILLHFAAAAIIALVVNWTGLIAWRRASDVHWTERARLLWPARVAASINFFLLPGILFFWHLALFSGDESYLVLEGLAAMAGAIAGSVPLDLAVNPGLTLHGWWQKFALFFVLRLGIWFMYMVAVFCMPVEAGWRMAAVTVGFLAPFFAIVLGGGVKLLRMLGAVGPPSDRMERIVRETAERMKTPVHAVWAMRGPIAQGSAVPLTRELILSERLMEICSDAEVSSVTAHELGHLGESKAAVAGRIAGSLAVVPLLFMKPAVYWLGLGGLALPLVTAFVIVAGAKRWSHRLERRADAIASTNQAEDGVYARALENAYRFNQIPAVNAGRRHTHPHLYDRMIAAGITPDFPRPQRPRRTSLGGMVCWALFLAGIFIALVMDAGRYDENPEGASAPDVARSRHRDNAG